MLNLIYFDSFAIAYAIYAVCFNNFIFQWRMCLIIYSAQRVFIPPSLSEPRDFSHTPISEE